MTDGTFDPERFDAPALESLGMAAALAQLTGHPAVRVAHVLLAAVQQDSGEIDAACRELLGGMRAATLADALRNRLEVVADLQDLRPGDFAPDGSLRAGDFDPSGHEVLRRAEAHAAAWGCPTVPVLALCCAACGVSDPVITHTLGINRLGPAALAAVGERLAASVPRQQRPTLELFRDGALNVTAFAEVPRAALASLAPVSVDRPLLDADLLLALLDRADSRLTSMARATGVDLAAARTLLEGVAPGTISARAVGHTTIAAARVGRLLSRVLTDALARGEADGGAEITEAHLLLAHLDRVDGSPDNLYARLGFAPAVLRASLAPAPVNPLAAAGVIRDGSLSAEAFGPLARAALRLLAPVAASRALVDTDLLWAFMTVPDSRLTYALHVLDAPVPRLRSALGQLVGSAARPAATGSGGTIPADRLAGLIGRLCAAAAAMAHAEQCPLIAESHLIRAHIDAVAGGSGNIYERFQIDTRRLREQLAKFTTDAEAAAAPPAAKPGQDIEAFLGGRVVNQTDAVRRAARALRRMRSGLGEPGQVMGKFLFLGATGVGKTELARAMAEIAFGVSAGAKDACMIRLDCGNFQDRRDLVQLIGASQGLVGYKEGQLTNGLREKPRSVILFDEAEKADPAIWQSLLPLFDEGLVREADGTEYDATGCVLIATSNLGYDKAIQKFDIWHQDWDAIKEMVEEFVWRQVQQYFSPEFLGRFGRENVIFFNHFRQEDYRRIIDAQLAALAVEMTQRGIALTFADRAAAVDLLATLAWADRKEGARPVRRLITGHVRDQMVAARSDDPGRATFHFTADPERERLALADA
jgi:hypothetical protein